MGSTESPEAIPALGDLIKTLRWAFADRCVKLANGNKVKAAKSLGVNLSTIYRQLVIVPTVPVELFDSILPKKLPIPPGSIQLRQKNPVAAVNIRDDSVTAVKLLDFLGVRVIRRKNFWVSNAGCLDYILYDAHKAYRKLAAESHPDRVRKGVPPVKTIHEINYAWDRLKQIFRNRGIT